MDEVFDQLETLKKMEKRVAMATLVATRGTSPKREGAKMWVGEEGRILGSVTIGGCVDARVIVESEKVLSSFEPRLVEMKLADEDAWEIGFSFAGQYQSTFSTCACDIRSFARSSAPGSSFSHCGTAYRKRRR